MTYKTKMKLERFLYGAVSFLGFACIGASVGYFLGSVEESTGKEMGDITFLALILLSLAAFYLFYFINICLHEIGHMLFGLLTGYQFHSIRFGKLMLVKKAGKLHFCRYNMPGTGGQCIMTAPDVPPEKMPVVLYNLGGLLVNLLLALMGVGLYLGLKNAYPLAGILCLVFALTALSILLSNGLPFPQLGTDGANAILLHKDKNSRATFQKQLAVAQHLANNVSLLEMPPELVSFDKSVPMDNPILTAQAVNHYNALSLQKKYGEAKEMAQFILDNTKSINPLHEKILYGELIFQAAVIDGDLETAKALYHAHKKALNAAAGFISIQRVLYAYYTLVERNEKKAAAFAKRFENSVKHYPFPKEAALEQEQFDMVCERL